MLGRGVDLELFDDLQQGEGISLPMVYSENTMNHLLKVCAELFSPSHAGVIHKNLSLIPIGFFETFFASLHEDPPRLWSVDFEEMTFSQALDRKKRAQDRLATMKAELSAVVEETRQADVSEVGHEGTD